MRVRKAKTSTNSIFIRCDWPPEGGCEGLVEPQWAEDEDEGGDAGAVEEAREVIMDV